MRLRKWVSIYFLVLALPATVLGLLPIIVYYPRSQEPYNPAEDLGVHPAMLFYAYSVLVFIALGWTNVYGYFFEIENQDLVPRWFWQQSSIYNAVLFLNNLVFFLMLRPWAASLHDRWGTILFVGLTSLPTLFPALGTFLSWKCLRLPSIENVRSGKSALPQKV